MNSSLQRYSEIAVSSEVLTASTHRMVQMLMDRCLQQIQAAKIAISNQDVQRKQQAITKATEIISYLRICLNFNDKRAKEMAENLDSLYEFVEKSFLQATLKNEVSSLEKAYTVLANIKEGWDGIASTK